ncbi:hypothetical protein DSCO28_15870 [Desulfosarcina ovata subsp. sediminis]|uniref:Sigma-54 factor interaction domain-containing protein n=1 Tax=Desulfosarcina ovata subsp. sediminis TaxID=885957 RepID=A0A5K7ZJG3_9BACT|nr:sigma 54-interacting transcriptional regulator [Desulfosarcina ovata]BBO81021.1 hypothetical protein DSCO28_15870 [Desulfosarcina ovata subsp. sediminis]
MNKNDFRAFFDKLDEQEQDVLHIATLIGYTFSLDNILDIADIKPSKLLGLADKLIDQGVLKNKSKSVKGLFSFRFKRMIIYVAEFMTDEKRSLHVKQIADYLERELQTGSDANKAASALSTLYLQSETKNTDFHHTKKAADLMVTIHKAEDALPLYNKIIKRLSARKRIGMENSILLESIVSFSMIAIYVRPVDELSKILKDGIDLAESLQNKRALAILEICFCILFRRKGLGADAATHQERGGQLTQTIDDLNLKKNVSRLVALSHFLEGRISDAIHLYEQSLGKIEEISLVLSDTWSYLMLAWSYGIAGKIGRGLGLAQAVLERSVRKGLTRTEAYAHGIIALVLVEAGRLDQAESHVDQAISLGKQNSSPFLLYMMKPCKGYLLCMKGDLKGARGFSKKGLEQLTDTIIQYPCPWFLELIYKLYRYKWKALPNHAFRAEIERLQNWPNKYLKGAALRYLAVTEASQAAENRHVLALLQESYQLLSDAGAPIEAGKTQLELARYHIEYGDMAKARSIAQEVYQTYSGIDESLFPSHMSNLIPRESKEHIKDRGLSEIVKAIDLLPDIEKYLGRIVTILTDLFGAERSAILLKDGNGSLNRFKMIATRNFTPEEIDQYQTPEKQAILLDAVKNSEFVLISTREDPTLLNELGGNGMTIRSLALFPLTLDNVVNGVIYLDNRLLSGILSKNDVMLLRNIAIQLSIAIKSLDIYSKSRAAEMSQMEDQTINVSSDDIETPFSHIVGKSKAIVEVMTQTKIVAGTDATVLVHGDTGVGKELIAHSVHRLSKRSDKPFVIVNVSALTPSLIESELFGHEKGAFTGADAAKPGRFELANGGSLFLDEIGELSMAVQVKLLRVLQEGTFERVGSNRTMKTEFRLIAATNKNLKELVARGEFRSDLFYRINSFPIHIPPLRERRADIQDLAAHFVNKYSKKNGKKIKQVSSSALKQLERYSWPGNVRELEHVIEKAVILSDDDEALLIDNLLAFHTETISKESGDDSFMTLEEIERNHMLRVLDHTKWRVRGENGAAKILGLKPTTMDFRMKKLGIK